MAGLAAVLTALGRAVWRDLRRLNTVLANNFFLFCFFALQGGSGAFLQLVLGLVLFFPLSADPLRKVPPDRLALWPLTAPQRVALRLGSIWLSPAAWLTVALLLYTASFSQVLPLLGLALAAQALPALGSATRSARGQTILLGPWPGVWGGLLRKDLRQMLRLLDVYTALVLSLFAIGYRLVTHQPDPDAIIGMTLLVVLALSTCAQTLFGLDSPSALTRLRLFPLRGWQVLASKDAAFLLILLPLVAPLAPLPGLAAGLAVLAIGHHASVLRRAPQTPWRFTGGSLLPHGLVQVIALFGAGLSLHRNPLLVLLICAAALLISLLFYGYRFKAEARES